MSPPRANNCRSLKVGVDCAWDEHKYPCLKGAEIWDELRGVTGACVSLRCNYFGSFARSEWVVDVSVHRVKSADRIVCVPMHECCKSPDKLCCSIKGGTGWKGRKTELPMNGPNP